ncbi:MAG: endolytic transglycosylase MltG [Alphaproteobacteria bacterium]|nr:endolytic transglycosylase MltG [Alphaproteobacteria bacterium]
MTVLVILATMAVAAVYVSSVLTRPGVGADTTIIITPGDGRVVISAKLNSRGIDHPIWVMRLEELMRAEDYVPKAGEFALPAGTSLTAAMDIIHQGASIQHNLTIPEGWTSRQVVDALYNDDRFAGVITPLPAEGTILPETYFFTRGASRNAMVIRLQQSQELAFAALWADRQKDLPFTTLNEAIVLASIVERETGISGERGKVASVFINRLRDGMRLQSDPTVLYGLAQAGEAVEELKRSHLKHPSPWNTYRHHGLPPTPIANPGRASLAAVLNPDDTDFYYFVADGTGGHKFAKTLKEHNRNVRAWRKIRDKARP